jgi:hypothetical protein
MGLQGEKDESAPSHLAQAMQSGIRDWQMRTFPGGHVFFLLRQKPCIEALVDLLASSTFQVREQHLRSPALLCREVEPPEEEVLHPRDFLPLCRKRLNHPRHEQNCAHGISTLTARRPAV